MNHRMIKKWDVGAYTEVGAYYICKQAKDVKGDKYEISRSPVAHSHWDRQTQWPDTTYHSLLLPLLEGAKVREDLEGWTPFLQLVLPVEHDRGGYDDQVWAPVPLLAGQVCQERDGLHRLAQTHLVSQDAIESPFVHGHQPV